MAKIAPPMIDKMLVCKARGQSRAITAVDKSWREYLAQRNHNDVIVPLRGDYTFSVKAKYIYVEGCRGDLVIDKITDGKTTYLLTEPLVCKDFAILGVYDSRGHFVEHVSRPNFGFHYLGFNGRGDMSMCLGDADFNTPDTMQELQRQCTQIFNSCRLINLCSLGTTAIKGHKAFMDVIENRDLTKTDSIKALKEMKLIKNIL
jgi:hypothetical protein